MAARNPAEFEPPWRQIEPYRCQPDLLCRAVGDLLEVLVSEPSLCPVISW
jgi:hypothetical protein